MKKLVVMLLAVAMTVAFASSVMAADLSWWMGGDFYYFYTTLDGDHDLNNAAGVFTVDSILTAQLTEGNSWAKMWYVNDTWNGRHANATNQAGDNGLYYAFGYNKIGGILDLGFSTKDTGIANMGQAPLGEFFNDFKSDPVFNTYDMGGAASAVITSGNFKLNAEYVTYFYSGGGPPSYSNVQFDTVDANNSTYAISGAFKFEGGDVHFGYKSQENSDDYLALIGANFTVGSAAVKVDLWLDGDTNAYANWGEVAAPAGGEKVQANVAFARWDATLFYANGEDDENLIGLGGNFKATDKLTIGAKLFDYDEADVTAWELYGLYDLGAFDVKFGLMQDDRLTDDDVCAVLGFHASIW